MAGKGYYVRSENGHYLGKRMLGGSGPRPWVDEPAYAAVFPTKLEADGMVKGLQEPEGPKLYPERIS